MSDDVTEADRAAAHALWNEILCNGGVPGWTATGAIAAALAAERAKAREPFLAELAGWEEESRAWYYEHRYDDTGIEYASGYEDGWDAAGKRIRRAAEEQQ